MSQPIATKTLKMIQYFKDHPDADVKKVAAKFKTALPVAYKTRKRARQELFNSMPEELANEATSEWSVGLDPKTGNIIATHGGEEHKVDTILDQRATQYGKFIDGAQVMQMLMRILTNRAAERGLTLAYDQAEAIHMICHKLGRIVNGNPDNVDSWRDIAGYATLVADRLEGRVR